MYQTAGLFHIQLHSRTSQPLFKFAWAWWTFDDFINCFDCYCFDYCYNCNDEL